MNAWAKAIKIQITINNQSQTEQFVIAHTMATAAFMNIAF